MYRTWGACDSYKTGYLKEIYTWSWTLIFSNRFLVPPMSLYFVNPNIRRKIPKMSPGAYIIFKGPFWGAYFLEGPILGGAFLYYNFFFGGGGACIWRALYMKGPFFGILRYPHTNSPDWSHQSIFPLVIISLILITSSLQGVLILLAEKWWWSLRGVNRDMQIRRSVMIY